VRQKEKARGTSVVVKIIMITYVMLVANDNHKMVLFFSDYLFITCKYILIYYRVTEKFILTHF